MPMTKSQENVLSPEDKRDPSQTQLAAVVEAAYILEALRK
jgi:hypothetical protein